MAGWAHNNPNLLKTLTTPFLSNNVVRLIMQPYLPAFHTGKVMVPRVEMNLELYFIPISTPLVPLPVAPGSSGMFNCGNRM